MNLAQELNNIAKNTPEPYTWEASDIETKSAYVYLTTRFRTMSSHGHTSAAFRLSDSLWQMPDLKVAFSMLENDGFIVEWHPNGLDDVIAVHWGV